MAHGTPDHNTERSRTEGQASMEPEPNKTSNQTATPPRTLWGHVRQKWSWYISLIGVLGGLGAGVTWFERGKQALLPSEQIDSALEQLRTGIPIESWTVALERLAEIPDNPQLYRQAASGLQERLRNRFRLDFLNRTNISPCSVASQEPVNSVALGLALRTLAVLSDSARMPLVLDSVELRGAVAPNLSVTTLRVRHSCLANATLSGLTADTVDLSGSELDTTDLSSATIGLGNFRDIRGTDLNLARTVMDSARFNDAILHRLSLSYASIPLSTFRNAELHDADLNHACLYGGNFGGASFRGASNWDSAVLNKAYFGNLSRSTPGALSTAAQMDSARTTLMEPAEQAALFEDAIRSFSAAVPPECATRHGVSR